jgi:uncharacterized protein YjbI with pentapeptide repeats
VSIINSKLVGAQFDSVNKAFLSIHFEGCQLNLSNFYGVDLSRCSFANVHLQEVDFTDADLRGVELKDCNLAGAIFDHTNLEDADLSTAENFIIDPENNRIQGAHFARHSLEGLLTKYQLHIH